MAFATDLYVYTHSSSHKYNEKPSRALKFSMRCDAI